MEYHEETKSKINALTMQRDSLLEQNYKLTSLLRLDDDEINRLAPYPDDKSKDDMMNAGLIHSYRDGFISCLNYLKQKLEEIK